MSQSFRHTRSLQQNHNRVQRKDGRNSGIEHMRNQNDCKHCNHFDYNRRKKQTLFLLTSSQWGAKSTVPLKKNWLKGLFKVWSTRPVRVVALCTSGPC